MKWLFISFLVFVAFLAFNNLSFLRLPGPEAPRRGIAEEKNMSGGPSIAEDLNNKILSVPQGFKIGVFARNLGPVRDLEFSEDGVLLVSVTGAGEVLALPDRNSDGQADEKKVILSNLKRPHGLAFYEGSLFIATETAVSRYSWDKEKLAVNLEKALFKLPKGGNHFTRSLVFDRSGRLYVSLGSTCNVCFEKDPYLAAVVTSDKDGNNPHLFAKGLRNSVFLAINPKTSKLWATEMGRDYLGDSLPPDEINIIEEGGDYGWPLCFGDRVHDQDFDKRVYIVSPCEKTTPPVFKIAAHSAPLGLTFIDSSQFPMSWQGDLLVAYHGSWNSSVPVGYKVVRLEVVGESIGKEEDFLTGFLRGAEVLGRPVDLAFDKDGSLYISDDKAGVIYKIIRSVER